MFDLVRESEDVTLHEAGIHAHPFCERACRHHALGREVHAGHLGAGERQADGIEPEVALQVQHPLAGDVAEHPAHYRIDGRAAGSATKPSTS
jgi:hypothetical protein